MITPPLAFLSYFAPKSRFIRQTESTECGLCCVLMIGASHGLDVDLAIARQRFSVSLAGCGLDTLLRMGDRFGLTGRPLRTELEELANIQLPAILHWNLSHYVVLEKVRNSRSGRVFRIADPAVGIRELDERAVSAAFTGVAIEFFRSKNFVRRSIGEKLRLSQLWSSLSGFWPQFCKVLAASITLQFLAFLLPFYVQLSVDAAIPSSDTGLLAALALGFAFVAILNGATAALRDLLVLRISSMVSFQISSNIFKHLVSLPVAYFEKRHVGDITSRFDASQPISELLSKGIVTAIIDGFLAVFVLAIITSYSVLLGAISLASISIYIVIRLLYFRALQTANISAISARASETSTVIETIRGITPIKLFVKESDRLRLWQRKRANVVNATVRMNTLQIWFDVASNVLMSLDHIAFIFVGARFVMTGNMTLGAMFAVQAYKGQFSTAMLRLVAQWVQLRMLDVSLGRLADIVLTPPENADQRSAGPARIATTSGKLRCQNLHFAYAAGDRPILRGVSLAVQPGQTVILAGPSGCGKTTLLKLLVGLHEPTKGRIVLDGYVPQKSGLSEYRRCIGTVMQDDVLYAGTILENISFFDPAISIALVEECAMRAQIHAEIMALPMGYETWIGDMGSMLSGGQRQRLLLARALYKRPKILFLDEGTAHLNADLESKLLDALHAIDITKIIVTHRPEAIRYADQILTMEGGKIAST